MNSKTRGMVVGAALLGLALCCALQASATSMGSNPLKIAMGLINIELEVRIAPQVSIHAFFEHVLVATDHPRWVLSVGPRLHVEVDLQGGYVGANLLVIGPAAHLDGVSLSAGPECGYRIPMVEAFYLQPRLLTSRSLQQPSRDAFGMEALVGVTLGSSG